MVAAGDEGVEGASVEARIVRRTRAQLAARGPAGLSRGECQLESKAVTVALPQGRRSGAGRP